MSVQDSYTFPAGDGMETASISTSQIASFQGSATATTIPPTTNDITQANSIAKGEVVFAVIALNNNTTSTPAEIQLLQNVSVSTLASGVNTGSESDYYGDFSANPPNSSQLNSSMTIQNKEGSIITSDQGPIDLVISNGETLGIGYSVEVYALAEGHYFTAAGEVLSSAGANFNAVLGYTAPPGWTLYIENADGSPGPALNEFTSATTAPEPSSWAALGLMGVGLGGMLLRGRRNKV